MVLGVVRGLIPGLKNNQTMNALKVKSPVYGLGPVWSEFFQRAMDSRFPMVAASTVPAVNITAGTEGYQLEMALPGFRKDDVKIELDENVLMVSSSKQDESDDNQAGYTRREFSYSSFRRRFSLPEDADAEKIVAGFQDGILKLSIPKKTEALKKGPRTIEVA
jgi:HSP20 family protein